MPGTGFVNWADLFRLNQPDAERMAGGVAADIQAQAPDVGVATMSSQKGVQAFEEPGARGSTPAGPANWADLFAQAQRGSAAAGLTNTMGGLQGLLQSRHGATSGGGSIMDAALTGQAGSGQFRGLREGYGNALTRINAMPRTAPAAAPSAQPPPSILPRQEELPAQTERLERQEEERRKRKTSPGPYRREF